VGLGIAVALGLFVVCGSASAGTLADFADTYISALNPVVNFGSSTDILVGPGAEALVQCNLSSLGVSSVSSASLLLWVDGIATSGGVDISMVTSPWSASSVTFNTQPTIAAPFLANAVVTVSGQYVSFDVTSAVNVWLASPITNFGFAINPAVAAPSTAFTFASQRNSINHPPELSAPAFGAVPEPASWLLTGAGLAFALLLRTKKLGRR